MFFINIEGFLIVCLYGRCEVINNKLLIAWL